MRPRPAQLALCFALAVCTGRGHAAFMSIDVLDEKHWRSFGVTVAVVRVTALHVDEERKRANYALYRYLDLGVVRHVYGQPVPDAGLKRVDYMPSGIDTACPDLGEKVVGSHMLMASINGHPCGVGSCVRLSRRFSLPMRISGPDDRRVEAVRAFLMKVHHGVPELRNQVLIRPFAASENPYLTLLADGALLHWYPAHDHSASRYVRLLSIVDASKGADFELGGAVALMLARFPPLRDRAAYEHWRRGKGAPAHGGPTVSFERFRQDVQDRFAAMARSADAELNLRYISLRALARSPCYIGARGDPLDARAESVTGHRIIEAGRVLPYHATTLPLYRSGTAPSQRPAQAEATPKEFSMVAPDFDFRVEQEGSR